MLTVEERPRYQSDFGVSWLRLPVAVAGMLLAATMLACSLKLVYTLGWYLNYLMALGSGLSLGGILIVLVDWTRCRNHWLAGSMGVIAGLVTYLGYYHIGLMDSLPPGNAWRVNLLPKYVWLRLQTDGGEQVGDLKRVIPRAKEPTPYTNCGCFVFELSLILGFPAAFAWKRARRAYCAELNQWTQQEKALLPAWSHGGFRAALDSGKLPQFAAAVAGRGTPPPRIASRFILEYAVPESGSPLDFPIYASFQDFPLPRPWYWTGNLRRTLIRQVELDQAEVMAMRPLFPKLAHLLEGKDSELPGLPLDVPIAPSSSPIGERAEIIPVPRRYRQRVVGKGYNLWVNFVGIPAWSYVRRLRWEIAQHPGRLIDPHDLGLIFVSLIPRGNLSEKGIKWKWASDLLLLKLDKRRRQLLMEGDLDRYRIPAAAIADCEPQCFFNPYDREGSSEHWMVRLVIQTERGRRELLLSVHLNHWRSMNTAWHRREMVENTCRQIAKLCGQEVP